MPHEILVTVVTVVVAAVAGAVLLVRNTLNSQQQQSGHQNDTRRNRPEPPPAQDRLNDFRNRPNRTEEEPVMLNCDLCEYVILGDAPRQTLNCLHSFHPICYNEIRNQMCPACMRQFY